MGGQLLLFHAHTHTIPFQFSSHSHCPKLHPHLLNPFPTIHRSLPQRTNTTLVCRANSKDKAPKQQNAQLSAPPSGQFVQTLLWLTEATYVLWLFLLPFAPGEPVWAIKSHTINDVLGLSLNFFFILPLLNSVGIHVMEAPVLHPMSEGLFNFVIAWTFLFAPLLYTDYRRDRYKGSLDVLWGGQLFLTNTFLIPYMAIRLNNEDGKKSSYKTTKLGSLMINGASIVGVIGGGVCLLSILWAFYGRMDGDFGGVAERWVFLVKYIESDRLAYAFIWDICLYSIFQPWLIGDNMKNVKKKYAGIVNKLKFVPVVGLVAYLLSLEDNVKREMQS